ncbi:MAG: glycosyltransferase [Candidatus Eisenbacteria bacterium]|nr:glycosyltransferase [Candidatus Eisenbacteria bacterium]
MKVAFVVESFDTAQDASGGVRLSVRKQADVLSRRHDVVVIAPHKVFPPLGRYSAMRRGRGQWPGFRSREENVRVYRPLLVHLPVLGGVLEPAQLVLFILAVCSLWERGVSLIHAHRCYPAGYAATLAAPLLRLPVLLTVYGSDVNAGLNRKAVGRWVSFATRQSLRRAGAVIAVSRALAERVRTVRAAALAVGVVPSGVDLSELGQSGREEARARLSLRADSRVILFAANLVPVKDPLTMLRAFGLLRDRRKDVLLAVLGRGEMEGAVSGECRSLGLSDSVMLLGRRPREEVPLWLAASDVVALSSTEEGCPVIALEGFASGRPFVGTAVGGLPEVVPEGTGILVEARNPAALAGALEEALNRAWNEEGLAAHGRKFSWESVVAEIEAVYAGLKSGEA